MLTRAQTQCLSVERRRDHNLSASARESRASEVFAVRMKIPEGTLRTTLELAPGGYRFLNGKAVAHERLKDGRLDGKKKEWKEGKRKMGCSAPKTP